MTINVWPDFSNPLGGFGGFFEEPLEKESQKNPNEDSGSADEQADS